MYSRKTYREQSLHNIWCDFEDRLAMSAIYRFTIYVTIDNLQQQSKQPWLHIVRTNLSRHYFAHKVLIKLQGPFPLSFDNVPNPVMGKTLTLKS